jgi:hypothetical protein
MDNWIFYFFSIKLSQCHNLSRGLGMLIWVNSIYLFYHSLIENVFN